MNEFGMEVKEELTKNNINRVLKAAKSFNFLMSSFNPGR